VDASTCCRAIGPIPVSFESDSTELLGPLEGVFRPWSGGRAAGAFRLRLRYGDPGPAESLRGDALRLFWSGTLRGGIPCQCYSGVGCRLVCLPGRAWGRLDIKRRTLEIICKSGQEACLYDGCLIPLLCELLASQGHFVIHAASLASDRRNESPGVLVAGSSGTGKTTTALALAHAGLVLLADDTSFLESAGPDGGEVRIWGWRLPCKVHENTRRILPWLQGCPSRPARTDGETLVDTTGVVGESTGRTARPRLLLLLGPRYPGDHVLEPLDRTQAMVRLTSENVRAYECGAQGPAGAAFRTLGQLVAQCDVYHLHVGTPLSTLAGEIHELLGRSA
jgi:hypothetical protein